MTPAPIPLFGDRGRRGRGKASGQACGARSGRRIQGLGVRGKGEGVLPCLWLRRVRRLLAFSILKLKCRGSLGNIALGMARGSMIGNDGLVVTCY